MNLVGALRKHGVVGTATRAARLGARMGSTAYHKWATRHAPQYQNPSDDELERIERDLKARGVLVEDYEPDPQPFFDFKDAGYFPSNWYGGVRGGVWDEKHLEHWIASEILELSTFSTTDVYVDIAACSSPWAKTLRERKNINAFAIDLEIGSDFSTLPYYRSENATATSFESGSVRAASLHCAYEMFSRNDDIELIAELARILQPGGRVVIVPLYMHTHYCAYSTPEFYGKGHSDPRAKEYVRRDMVGVPSSRKYDVDTLKQRVLNAIEAAGLRYRMRALRNKNELGKGIYCHFILQVDK